MKIISDSAMTLFSVANRLYREGRYIESVIIYEFLSEQCPDFAPYANNETLARMALAKKSGIHQLNTKYHYKDATECQKRLRIAEIVSQLNDPELIGVCFDNDRDLSDPQHFLARANASIAHGYDQWLEQVNRYLQSHGLLPLSFEPQNQREGQSPLLNLNASKPVVEVEGPLVSVCMSCFNAAPFVEQAVRSLLKQSYRNFELFLFNDQSTDGTIKILRRLECEDKRITVIDTPVNQGTYVSRNQAFQRAKGEFFTTLDADDFALPERFARQVAHLQQHPNHVGVMTEWVRMHADGRFYFRANWSGVYSHQSVSTLMVRTKEVRKRIGYWDSVRFAADTEFLFRLQQVFGEAAVPLLKFPTVIALFHEASLTRDPVTGVDVGGITGLSPTRKIYRNTWLKWHKRCGGNLYMPFPLKQRPFDAPFEMLSTGVSSNN